MGGHHAVPKFLGGKAWQGLVKELGPKHQEFHSLLRQYLRDANIPLDAANTSAAEWRRYFRANAGSQRLAFDAVLNAARDIDVKYGTDITQFFWKNLMEDRVAIYP